jgi:hypothetical protein
LNTYSQVDAQLMFMKRRKFLLAMKSRDETMSDFINRLKTLRDELVGTSYVMPKDEFLLTLMSGTHQEFGTFVSSMTGKKNVSEIDLDDLCDKLIREDDLRRMDESNNINNQSSGKRIMYANESGHSYKNKKKFLNYKKKFKSQVNRNSDKQRYGSKQIEKDKVKIKQNRRCYICGKKGHYANECRSRLR